MGYSWKVKRIEGVVIQREALTEVRCLGHCGAKFIPEHRWNRVCPSCAQQNKGVNARVFGVSGKIGQE